MRAIYCVHLYNIKQHYIYNISHYQRITHNTQLTKNIWRVPPGLLPYNSRLFQHQILLKVPSECITTEF